MKPVIINTTKDKIIDHHISIFSGYYSLSELDKKLIGSIVRYYLDLRSKINDISLLNQNFFNNEHRKLLMNELSIPASQLTKYVKRLIEKKILKDTNGDISINSKFIPTNDNKIEFKFNIIE